MTHRDITIGFIGAVIGLTLSVGTAVSQNIDIGATVVDFPTLIQLLKEHGGRITVRSQETPRSAAISSAERSRGESSSAASQEVAPVATPCDIVREAFAKIRVVGTDERKYTHVATAMRQVEAEYCEHTSSN